MQDEMVILNMQQPYAPAPSLLFPEDYCWVDRQGRPASPPQPPRQTPSATERNLRKVGERIPQL